MFGHVSLNNLPSLRLQIELNFYNKIAFKTMESKQTKKSLD